MSSGEDVNKCDDVEDYMADISLFVKEDVTAMASKKQKAAFLSPSGAALKSTPSARAGNKRQRKAQQRQEKQAKEQLTEDSLRNEGLAAEIPSSNIGFKMLQRMGYQRGEALGKTKQGQVEPVAVEVKRGRMGLGREEEEKRRKAEKEVWAEQKRSMQIDKQREMGTAYKERAREQWENRRIAQDVGKCRGALAQLRGEDDILLPKKEVSKKDTQKKGEERYHQKQRGRFDRKNAVSSVSPHKKKELQLMSLKKSVCSPLSAMHADDSDAEEAAELLGVSEEGNTDEEEEEDEEEISLEVLNDLLDTLRAEFHFCIYCGVQYRSESELQEECPGRDADAH
ncbi:hypothetical protein CBR_g4860 [Chara braunii]|uniref:G-patch domain-containing protein n=1 Tax=Chara braunii TaxID=69332 RepID=A0A388KJ12_CHABU|nr:hypothetical protein CBR_g4860 [Chara braunii]|eukprot:GBG70032.1 hypothetical protein CBR_g4860 [Chara braunii]